MSNIFKAFMYVIFKKKKYFIALLILFLPVFFLITYNYIDNPVKIYKSMEVISDYAPFLTMFVVAIGVPVSRMVFDNDYILYSLTLYSKVLSAYALWIAVFITMALNYLIVVFGILGINILCKGIAFEMAGIASVAGWLFEKILALTRLSFLCIFPLFCTDNIKYYRVSVLVTCLYVNMGIFMIDHATKFRWLRVILPFQLTGSLCDWKRIDILSILFTVAELLIMGYVICRKCSGTDLIRMEKPV